MPSLTQDQVDQIVLTLGYSSVSKVCELAQLAEPYSQVAIDRVDALLLGLAALDQKLVDATADSMAVGVGQLNLNYAQHVAHLKSEGSRSLRELSQILGVRLAYNKYAGASSISMRSYW